MNHRPYLLLLAVGLLSACGTMRETTAVRDDVYDIPDRTAVASTSDEPEQSNQQSTAANDDYYDPNTAKQYSGRNYYDITYNDPYWYNRGRFGMGYDQWSPNWNMGMNYGYGSPYGYGGGYGYGSDPYWNNSWQSGYGAWGYGNNGWNSSGWGMSFGYGYPSYGYGWGSSCYSCGWGGWGGWGGYGSSCYSCGWGSYGYGGWGNYGYGGWGPYQGPYGSCYSCYSPVDYGTSTRVGPRPSMTGSSGNFNANAQAAPRMHYENPVGLLRPARPAAARPDRAVPGNVPRPQREVPTVRPERERPQVTQREHRDPPRTSPSDGGGRGRGTGFGGGGGGNFGGGGGGGGHSPSPRPRR